MTSDQGVFFKPLNEKERLSKLAQLSNLTPSNIIVWEKGKKEKYTLTIGAFSRIKSEFKIIGKYPVTFIDKIILLTFEINGLHFFGKCKTKYCCRTR